MIVTRYHEEESALSLKLALASTYENGFCSEDNVGFITFMHDNSNEHEIPRSMVTKFIKEVNELIEENNRRDKDYEEYAKQCRG